MRRRQPALCTSAAAGQSASTGSRVSSTNTWPVLPWHQTVSCHAGRQAGGQAPTAASPAGAAARPAARPPPARGGCRSWPLPPPPPSWPVGGAGGARYSETWHAASSPPLKALNCQHWRPRPAVLLLTCSCHSRASTRTSSSANIAQGAVTLRHPLTRGGALDVQSSLAPCPILLPRRPAHLRPPPAHSPGSPAQHAARGNR